MTPIEYPDIGWFVALTRQHLAPWEIETIEALDDAWLASHSTSDAETEQQ